MGDTGGQPLDYAPVKRIPEVNWRKMLLVAVITIGAIILVSFVFLPEPHVHGPPSSASRLRHITSASIGYAVDFGAFPDSFETLVQSEWTVPADYFASPKGPATPAPDYKTLFSEPGHISYVWIGAGLTWEMVEADTPLVYEGPVTDFEAGTLVGFVEGSVRLVKGEELRKLLSEAEERLSSATTLPTTRPTTSPTTTPTSSDGPRVFGE
jgi:hypothetical protein